MHPCLKLKLHRTEQEKKTGYPTREGEERYSPLWLQVLVHLTAGL